MAGDVPRVLLDTTAFIETGYGHSGPFRHLLRAALDRRVEVIVLDAVLDETSFVYRRELQEHRSALKALPRLVRAAGQSLDLLDQSTHVARMTKELRDRLAEAGIVPRPSVALDADEVVRRIHQRRKPTKPLVFDSAHKEEKDQPEGFRDQLIWANVRAAAQDGPITFVTGNTKDFAKAKTAVDGRAELHPDLVDDLAEDAAAGGSPGGVELVLDVETFVREYLRDEDWIADMQRHLDGEPGEELKRLVRDETMHGIAMHEFTTEDLVEGDVEESTASDLRDIELSLTDVFVKSEDEEPRTYGVSLQIEADAQVDWYVSAPSAFDRDAYSELGDDPDNFDPIMSQESGVPIVITAYVDYTPSTDAWDDLVLDWVALEGAEAAEREKRHSNQAFKRDQQLGLLPSDEEIEADILEHDAGPDEET